MKTFSRSAMKSVMSFNPDDFGAVFDSIQRERNNIMQDMTDNGICTECGNCCGRLIPLSWEEKRIIHKYIKRNGIKRQNSELNFLAQQKFKMDCPFLMDTKTHRCAIYEVRPAICRTFKCDFQKHLRDEAEKMEKLANMDLEITDMVEEFYGGTA